MKIFCLFLLQEVLPNYEIPDRLKHPNPPKVVRILTTDEPMKKSIPEFKVYVENGKTFISGYEKIYNKSFNGITYRRG